MFFGFMSEVISLYVVDMDLCVIVYDDHGCCEYRVMS